MPQTTALSEGQGDIGNAKSFPQPAEKSGTPESESMKPMTQRPTNMSGQQNKYLSGSVNNPILNKKRLQSHSGHPYQSSHPSNTRLDLQVASRDNLSSFTQRVMSAKLLRMKSLQNQLSEANLQLNELITENRLLRALQKKQDLALDRYEGTQAQLPQLVRSHQEEVRVLRTKYKNLKHQYRSVTSTLKEREMELQNLKEQHSHLLKLSKDRNLGEREALAKEVNDLKMTVDNQTSTIQVLNRKVLLETKNLKFQLHQEMLRHKATQSELQQTYIKMDQLQVQLDQAKERSSLPLSMDRCGKASSLKFVTHKAPRGITMDKIPIQNSRNRKTTKENETRLSANNTDPSSALLDSSLATSSEKTNEFSTSIESSPEHTANAMDTSDSSVPSTLKSNSYQLHRSILQKSGNDVNINFDSNKSKIPLETCPSVKGFRDGTLEEEYENAVATLAKLSNKHNGSFMEDISCSLASLDLKSAKHVATLANATFALKGELSSRTKFKQNELPPMHGQELQPQEDVFFTPIKNQQNPVNENKNNSQAYFSSNVSRMKSEQFAKTSVCDVENSHEISNSSESVKTVKGKSSSPIPMKDLQQTNKNKEEEVEASCKEALLKALKAIDDNSSQGNDSDGSDSGIIKMSSGAGITQRNFPGIGVTDMLGPSKRKRPFK